MEESNTFVHADLLIFLDWRRIDTGESLFLGFAVLK